MSVNESYIAYASSEDLTSAADSIGASAANTVAKTITVQAAAGDLTLNLELDANAAIAPASYVSGWERAATLLSEAIHIPITVNLEIGYGENPLYDNPEAVGDADAYTIFGNTGYSYTQLRDFLTATGASDVISALSYLPTTSSLNGQTNFSISTAEAKAFGKLASNDAGIDGYVGFGGDISSSELVGVALHEFTHALGRSSVMGTNLLSLFRYTSPGNHYFGSEVENAPATYFSIDGGKTDLADFGRYSDASDFLNPSNTVNPPPYSNLTPNDAFNELYGANTLQSLTQVDRTLLDMLGFGMTATPGDGTFASPNFVLAAFGTRAAAGSWINQDQNPRLVGDVNGDGAADIVGFGADGVYVALATGDGHFAAPQFALAAFGTRAAAGSWIDQDQNPRLVGDVNGDGTADIVGFGADGVYVALGTGNGHFADPQFALAAFGTRAAAGSWTSQNQNPRVLADVNGDGKADIVGFGADGVYVALATGNGHFAAPQFALAAFGTRAGAGSWTSQNQNPRDLADVNHDGRADIVGFGADGVTVALANAPNPAQPATAFGFGDLTTAAPTASATSSTSFLSGGAASDTNATAATIDELQLATQALALTDHHS